MADMGSSACLVCRRNGISALLQPSAGVLFEALAMVHDTTERQRVGGLQSLKHAAKRSVSRAGGKTAEAAAVQIAISVRPLTSSQEKGRELVGPRPQLGKRSVRCRGTAWSPRRHCLWP